MPDTFEDLKVFQEAHSLAIQIYKVSQKFPPTERFGLTAQLRRSASSVAANIVEGKARNHRKEFLQFLYLSKGSLEETKYHILLARDLKYMESRIYEGLHNKAEEVGRLLSGLIRYLSIPNKKTT